MSVAAFSEDGPHTDSAVGTQEMLSKLKQQKMGLISPFGTLIHHVRADADKEEVCAKYYDIQDAVVVCVLDKHMAPVFFKIDDHWARCTQVKEEELKLPVDAGWFITWWNVDRPTWKISNFILEQRGQHDHR